MNKLEKTFKNKRVLVTGGSGFLGTNLLDALYNFDCEILRLGRTSGIKIMGRKARVHDLVGDFGELSIWEKAIKEVDIVFHLAAQTSDKIAGNNVGRDLDANVRPMVNLLEACRLKGLKPTVFFAGSITQVGVPDQVPFDEKHVDNPVTVYDLHKLISEEYLKYYIREGIVSGCILRLASVYGPGPESSSNERGVLNQMIMRAIGGSTLNVWGKGNYLRDYIFVGDVVKAFLTAAVNISLVDGQHFVIGSGKGHTILEAFKIVSARVGQATGKIAKVIHKNLQNMPQSDRHDFLIKPKLFMTTTGWRPDFSLERGIDETIKHLMQHS